MHVQIAEKRLPVCNAIGAGLPVGSSRSDGGTGGRNPIRCRVGVGEPVPPNPRQQWQGDCDTQYRD